MGTTIESFGKTKTGKEAHLYKIKNNFCTLAVTDFGATLVSILIPDKAGKIEDVVLGYEDVSGYENHGDHLGATVGRNANRIGNACFILDEKEYPLVINDHEQNNLHSGPDFYGQRIWATQPVNFAENKVTFVLNSPDKDQGYPGNMEIKVTYLLTDDCTVRIIYEAKSDANTIINLTNHSYFNLSGDGNGNVLEHKVWIDADAFTPTDKYLIPTGEIRQVENTPMDFRVEKNIGKDIFSFYEPLVLAGGYDHNWVLKNEGKLALVATCTEEKSGRKMEVSTDMPGIQMYTGNFLNHTGRGGAYKKHSAVCFESQYFPDAVNHKNFLSPILKADLEYRSITQYRFIV